MDIDESDRRRYLDLLARVAPDEAANIMTFDIVLQAHLRHRLRHSDTPVNLLAGPSGGLTDSGLADTVFYFTPYMLWLADKVFGVAVENAAVTATRRVRRSVRSAYRFVTGRRVDAPSAGATPREYVDYLVANHGFPIDHSEATVRAIEWYRESGRRRDGDSTEE